MFTQDPEGGGRAQVGIGDENDNFLLTQVASNDAVLDADGSRVITEMQIPWENFDAADPGDDPLRDFGLFHPVAPEPNETWFFTIGLIPSEGELPTWHVQTGGPFAPRPHGLITFVESLIPDPWPGDVNGDGRTDPADLNIMAINWQMTGKTYEEGDLTGDGIVNAADLNILGGNWRTMRPAAAAVPEPSAAIVLLLRNKVPTLQSLG